MQNIMRALRRLLSNQTPEVSNLYRQEQIKSLLDCLSTTLDNEADCEQFNMEMDCLAEMIAAGKARGDVLSPEMEAHIKHSNDCREEFEALIAILRAEEAGELGSSEVK
ncbi:MAG: hypothetical protein L0154_19115 [Chloroflexi bacterium]|nr:hypothetical protein [Chloroflexota bacterium]